MPSLLLKSGIGVFSTSRDSIVVPVTKDSMLTIKVETSVTLFRNRSQPREKMLPIIPFFLFPRMRRQRGSVHSIRISTRRLFVNWRPGYTRVVVGILRLVRGSHVQILVHLIEKPSKTMRDSQHPLRRRISKEVIWIRGAVAQYRYKLKAVKFLARRAMSSLDRP